MPEPDVSHPLLRLPDGTVKQVNPLSGTQVWTVPGRADRPLPVLAGSDQPLDPAEHGRHCAFCELRQLDATPEKARLVREGPDGATWRTLTGLTAEELDDTSAEFRLIPNLFEIVSVDYWRLNHGLEFSDLARARHAHYASTPGGRAHLDHLRTLRGKSNDPLYAVGSPEAAELTELGFFGGFHDVVVARRHYVDGATREDQLASSGTLTPEEHREYVDFTVGAAQWMFEMNPLIRNVAIFQNWLRPAGASFDHLHKQVVGIDALGQLREEELARLAHDPHLFQHAVLDPVAEHDLWVAANEHAIAFVGIGHLYPSIEIWARRMDAAPWELTPTELDAWSDLLHAVHAATGSGVPTNEEWHYRPPQIDAAMPLRAVLKWRINTLAGFEGGTKIHINTIDPWTLRDRVREAMRAQHEAGVIAAQVAIAG